MVVEIKTEKKKVKSQDSNTKKIVGLIIAVAIFLIFWFFPVVSGMKIEQQRVLGLLLFTITLWVSRPWMPALTGMMFMILAWGLGLAKDSVALYGFSDSTPWFIWGGLLLALAVKETNLHLRIAYNLLGRVAPSTKAVMIVNYFVQYVLSLVIPSTTARVTTTAPIAASQIEALGLPLKSRAGKMMMISLIMAAFLATRGTLTGGSTQILAWGILKDNGIYISWLQWFLMMLFPVVLGICLMFIGYWIMFKPEPAVTVDRETGEQMSDIREIANKELRKMGPMSGGEKRVAGILILAVILWCTEKIHGIDSDLVGIAMGAAMCLPVVGALDAKDAFKKINWGNIVFVAAALSIGQVTEKSGIGDWLSGVLKPILSLGSSEVIFLLLLLVLGFLGRLLLRSGAANAAVLLVPTVTLANSLGYHAALVGVLFPMILAGIFIYQHTYGLIAYDYGTFEEKDFIIASFVRYAAVIIAIVLSYYFWWPTIGVL